MTATKPKKPSSKVLSRTNAPSSAERRMERSMNYWLERISAEDISKFWLQLKESAKDARYHMILEQWESGIMSKGDLRGAVTAYTTPDGFVLNFTVSGT